MQLDFFLHSNITLNNSYLTNRSRAANFKLNHYYITYAHLSRNFRINFYARNFRRYPIIIHNAGKCLDILFGRMQNSWKIHPMLPESNTERRVYSHLIIERDLSASNNCDARRMYMISMKSDCLWGVMPRLSIRSCSLKYARYNLGLTLILDYHKSFPCFETVG